MDDICRSVFHCGNKHTLDLTYLTRTSCLCTHPPLTSTLSWSGLFLQSSHLLCLLPITTSPFVVDLLYNFQLKYAWPWPTCICICKYFLVNDSSSTDDNLNELVWLICTKVFIYRFLLRPTDGSRHFFLSWMKFISWLSSSSIRRELKRFKFSCLFQLSAKKL